MEFGVSTNDDETDFHFDFDQEGDVCSYVNTTQQSEDRRSTEMGKYSHSRKVSNDYMGSIQEASKESYLAESSLPDTRRNIQEFKSAHKLDESEESSGYVVDYEQMLKDAKVPATFGGIPKGGFRENDIGQQPILE